MEHNFQISIPTDEDGYLSLVCEFCGDRFKLEGSEVQDESIDLIFCPVCGIKGEVSSFLPPDVIEAAQRAAENMMADILNGFSKSLKMSLPSSNSVSVDIKDIPKQADKIISEQNDLEMISFECCGKSAKVHPVQESAGVLYCPYCGVNK